MPAIQTTEARLYFTPPADEHRFLPEGPRPVVVGGKPALVWVNIQTAADSTVGSLWVRFLNDGTNAYHVPAPARPGFFAPTDRENVVLVGAGKHLRTCNLLTGEWSEPLAEIPDDIPRTIINDGEIVPGGEAIVFGTKDVTFTEQIAELYLFTAADRRITKLAGGQMCSNGKVFARDDRGLVLFDIDTPRRVVTRYRLSVRQRSLVEEGIALDLRKTPGYPDGMCDAGDGTAIIAFYEPEPLPFGRASRYRLDTGELLEEWHTPGSPRVTCPLLLSQPDGVKLILTTATEGMPDELRQKCPNAGCLFVADTSFATIPPPEFVRLNG